MSEAFRGLVKWFNDAKGFGFIESKDGDVFVHYSVIESGGFKTLKDGEEVEYELQQGEKGLHAKKVTRVNPPKEDPKPEKKKQKGLASKIEVLRVDQESPVSTEDAQTEAELTESAHLAAEASAPAKSQRSK